MKTPPFDFTIPRYWEPEEALAVYELLHELADLIWSQYETPLLELLAQRALSPRLLRLRARDTEPIDRFDPGDPIPF